MKKSKLAMYIALALLLVPVVALGQEVYQYGSRNEATLDITGGTTLSAVINQGTSTADAFDNVATITQVEGNTNNATIKQLGKWSNAEQFQYYGTNNKALIEQEGNGTGLATMNKATQTQGVNDVAAPFSTDNFAYIKQIGNSNQATQTQTGTFNNAALLVNNTPGIFQNGNGNIATQTQNGNSNEATISQTGNSNQATQTQTGDNHKAYITQNGNNNQCTQDLGGLIARTSTVTQTGNFNIATVTMR